MAHDESVTNHAQPHYYKGLRMGRRFFVFLCCVTLFGGCGDIESYSSAEQCYFAAFGTHPEPAVSNLQGEGKSFRNSGHCYLRFRIPEQSLKKLLGEHFRNITRAEFMKDTESGCLVGPRPAWWLPLAGDPGTFMRSETLHLHFRNGKAFLSYDAKTEIVHLYWNGI